MKTCLGCKKELPLTSFGKAGKTRAGTLKFKPRCSSRCQPVYERTIFNNKLYSAVGGKQNLKCTRCGYNRYTGALEFHHSDPSKKDLNIGRMKNYSLKKIKQEVEKCTLLCSNCHREAHSGLTTLIGVS